MTFTLCEGNQQKALSRVISNIRESLDIDTIFKTTVTEVRQLLNTDRVGVLRFYSESAGEGEFLYEDVGEKWVSVLATKLQEDYFAEEFTKLYQQGRMKAIALISMKIESMKATSKFSKNSKLERTSRLP